MACVEEPGFKKNFPQNAWIKITKILKKKKKTATAKVSSWSTKGTHITFWEGEHTEKVYMNKAHKASVIWL